MVKLKEEVKPISLTEVRSEIDFPIFDLIRDGQDFKLAAMLSKLEDKINEIVKYLNMV